MKIRKLPVIWGLLSIIAGALTGPAYGADDFDANAASTLRNINSELRRIAKTPALPSSSNNFSQQKPLKDKAFTLPIAPIDGVAAVPPNAFDLAREETAL